MTGRADDHNCPLPLQQDAHAITRRAVSFDGVCVHGLFYCAENTAFQFDHTFDESEGTEAVYRCV